MTSSGLLLAAQTSAALALWPFYLLAGLIGAIAASIEIATRFRDEPVKALSYRESIAYLTVNFLVGALAFQIAWASQASPSADQAPMFASLAGLGATMLIRAKVITLKISGQEVGIGPGLIVDKLLRALDRQIDRRRALDRTNLVQSSMAGVAYDDAKATLETHLLRALITLTKEEKEEIGRLVGEIEESPRSDQERAMSMGYLVLDIAGEKFLRRFFPPTG
ncbi:MAG: hypothetical protein AB7G11_05955 [Phycisphaerales bacterium]